MNNHIPNASMFVDNEKQKKKRAYKKDITYELDQAGYNHIICTPQKYVRLFTLRRNESLPNRIGIDE